MIEEHKDHDAVCVDIVSQISNLGGFKVEFPVYLTCYADKGECMYYISSDKEHVYQFMDESLKQNVASKKEHGKQAIQDGENRK